MAPTSPLPQSTQPALSRAEHDNTHTPIMSTIEDIHISTLATPVSRAKLAASQRIPATQSAASMMESTTDVFHCCSPIDNLLGGGLARGHILELSGPPGTPKGNLALGLIRDFIGRDEEVLMLDPQNMTTPAMLDRYLSQSSTTADYKQTVHLLDISTTHEFIAFMHNLPSFLQKNPKITLLVINSISFFFQTSPSSSTSFAWRKPLLERLKPAFTRACAGQNLSIVITSQLATKMVQADGTTGNFDTGSRAVMVPYLGDTYLPSARTYRIIIVPESQTTGVVRLIGSPSGSRKGELKEERYKMVDGDMEVCQ